MFFLCGWSLGGIAFLYVCISDDELNDIARYSINNVTLRFIVLL